MSDHEGASLQPTDVASSLAVAIDEVAARMTAAGVPADFSAHVLRRIGDRRPAAWRWVLKPVAALTLVGVVAMAAQAIRTARFVDRREPPAARTAESGTPTAAGNAVPVVERAPATAARARRSPPTPRISAAEAAWRQRAVPALEPLDALTIDGIQPEALSVPQLNVKALATAPAVLATDGKGQG